MLTCRAEYGARELADASRDFSAWDIQRRLLSTKHFSNGTRIENLCEHAYVRSETCYPGYRSLGRCKEPVALLL